jgi:Septum formation
MTMSRTTRPLATAAALALALIGLTTAPAHAGHQTRAADPLHGAPTVGTCSTMTAKQANASADHSTPVACTATHTAEVAGVVTLPSGLRWGTASTADLFRVVADTCAPAVHRLLGRHAATRDSSAYSYVWFAPTKAQRGKGARWLSCSVVLPRAAALASLPRSTSPFLPSGALPDRVARCLTRSALSTPCKVGHLWRATGTFTVAGKYPGTKVLDRKATRRCVSRVHSPAFRWTYKDKITWNVGHDHVVVCYSRTSG